MTPEGRKLLRIEARNSQTPIERKPEWIKTRLKMGPQYKELTNLVKSEGLHTVCQEAGCPNIFECWEDREATFLIVLPQAPEATPVGKHALEDRDLSAPPELRRGPNREVEDPHWPPRRPHEPHGNPLSCGPTR